MKETRNTNQREIVKQVLLKERKHLTADQIYDYVHKEYPTISRATVFRNLKTLAQRNEIGHVPVSDGADYFDYRLHEHYHFKCTRCKEVYDTSIVYDKQLDDIAMEFKVSHHVTIFYGICNDCLNENKS